MRNEMYQSFFHEFMVEYFDFAERGDKTVSVDMILDYGRIRRNSKEININAYAAEIREMS